ncbi:MAG: hypothetical protein IJN13_03910 [Bacilli bacterium]|nr:hypothetical protein [Bacilli bacterium]
MQVVNKKMCVIVILVLVIIESCTLFLMYKSFSNKNTNLDEVNLNINNSNMFAIMLEQEDGTYKEDSTNTWPTSGYTYNESMSGCIDINGNRIEDALTYDKENNKASVNTTNTSYCYLYFKIYLPTIYETILQTSGSGLSDKLIAGMYRYQGTTANNYICFGTSDKNTCVNETNKYMYRIIGITEDEKIKLLKDSTLNTLYYWHNDNTDEVIWPNSDLYKGLNGIDGASYSNMFINNSNFTYLNTSNMWYKKILFFDWKYGSFFLDNKNGIEIFELEENLIDSVNSKIGLMYASDYYLAYDNSIIYYNSGESEHNPGSWLSAFNSTERLLSYYGYSARNGGFNSYSVICDNSCSMGIYGINEEHSIRPTFFIRADELSKGGTGTSADPYIIK